MLKYLQQLKKSTVKITKLLQTSSMNSLGTLVKMRQRQIDEVASEESYNMNQNHFVPKRYPPLQNFPLVYCEK